MRECSESFTPPSCPWTTARVRWGWRGVSVLHDGLRGAASELTSIALPSALSSENMNCLLYSSRKRVERRRSEKRPYTRLMSSFSTSAPLRCLQQREPHMIMCMAYLRLVSLAIRVSRSSASAAISTSSSSHRICRIDLSSFSVYGFVGMIMQRSSRSKGMPWGER